MRPRTQRIQLVRRPPLSQVPVFRQGQMVGEAAGGALRVRVFPCRVYPARGTGRAGPPKQTPVYDLLFRATADTLQSIAADPQHLGAQSGFFCVLHSWGQTLNFHPHLHCVVPGGGISLDGSRWVACRPGFFLPVNVLSCRFRRTLPAISGANLRGRQTAVLRRTAGTVGSQELRPVFGAAP